MNFDKLIKEIKTQKPEDEEEALELKEDLKNFTMLKKIKAKKTKTRADFEKAFSGLCYSSPAFCCDISKPCLHRNAVLDALGVSLEEFRKRKMRWHDRFIEDFSKNTSTKLKK